MMMRDNKVTKRERKRERKDEKPHLGNFHLHFCAIGLKRHESDSHVGDYEFLYSR